MPVTAKELQEKCSEAGLKLTGQRKAILEVLETSEDHPSVEDVYMRAKERDQSVSIATVYRTLGMLDELGLVIKHDFGDNLSRFELNQGEDGHHDHLIDTESGEVIEFTNEQHEKLAHKIAAELGYEVVDHVFEIYGRKIKKS